MHRPKPVVQPVTLRLDRLIVRVDRLLRNRLILPRLVIPLTPKPPHQSLPPRLHRHPRPPHSPSPSSSRPRLLSPLTTLSSLLPQPLRHPGVREDPVLSQSKEPALSLPVEAACPEPVEGGGPISNQLALPHPSHPWQPSLTKCSLPPPLLSPPSHFQLPAT